MQSRNFFLSTENIVVFFQSHRISGPSHVHIFKLIINDEIINFVMNEKSQVTYVGIYVIIWSHKPTYIPTD